MDCLSCLYRTRVAGSTHSSCKHPVVNELWNIPFAGVLAIVGGFTPMIPILQVDEKVLPLLEIDPWGIQKGWAAWPYNYDPIWITRCELYSGRKDNGTKNN